MLKASALAADDVPGEAFAEARLAERRWLLFCAAALAVLIPLVFAPALNDYRVSDSFRLVGQIDFPVALQYFQQTSGFGRNEYRPVVLLTFAWDNLIWQDRPFGYHLTNVLLHTANGILLLLVLYRLTGNLLLAFVAATLFAFNPTHHSRVAFIAARDSAVCLFFLLISWLAYLHRRPTPRDASGAAESQQRASSRLLAGASCAAFLLALFSYEGAVAFPFILGAVELLLGRARCWPERVRNALRATGPYFLLLVLYVVWWLFLFRGSVGAYDLDLSVAGLGSNLYRLHYRLFHHIQHWLGLFYLLAFYLVWRNRKRAGPLVGVSLALLWLGYLPFLPVRGYADRFGFLSAIGVALFLSLCATRIVQNGGEGIRVRDLLPVAMLLLFVGYYTHSTGRRLTEWSEAGQKAESLLTQLKALHPSFPPNATLVLDQIPPMHGNAYVFPTGLRAALGSRYQLPPPQIHYFPTALAPSLQEELLKASPSFHFRYLPEQDRLVEVSARYN
jgi:hypothetical protein